MSPIFRVKFYVMSKFSLTDELSTIIKPHHRISRLEGTFKVEESSRSVLRASQQGLAQLLFRNCEWVRLPELWGLMDGKEEHTGGLLLGEDKMVLPGACLVSFVSVTANMVLSQRLTANLVKTPWLTNYNLGVCCGFKMARDCLALVPLRMRVYPPSFWVWLASVTAVTSRT